MCSFLRVGGLVTLSLADTSSSSSSTAFISESSFHSSSDTVRLISVRRQLADQHWAEQTAIRIRLDSQRLQAVNM